MRISDWSSDVCSSDLSEGQRSKLRLDTEAKANVRFGATCLITPRAAYRQQRADYGDINSATENLQKFATIGADFTCERPGLFPVASYAHATTRHADQFHYAAPTSDLLLSGIGYAMPRLGPLTAYFERGNSKHDPTGIDNP